MVQIKRFFENSIVKSVIIGVLVIFSVFGVRNVIAQNNTTSYYACVNNSSGTIKMVDFDQNCGQNETKISWNQVGPKGDKGDKGDQGPVGATGPQGDKGDQGPAGTTGPQGDKGDQGPVGATGPQGDKGDQGPVGATGPQGDKGDQGPVAVGATGPQGPPGPAGQGGTGLKFIAGHVNLMVQNGYVPIIVSGSGFTVDVLNNIPVFPPLTVRFPPGTFNSIAIPVIQPIGSYTQLQDGKNPLLVSYTVRNDGSMDFRLRLTYTERSTWELGDIISGFTFVVTETGTPLPSTTISHTILD